MFSHHLNSLFHIQSFLFILESIFLGKFFVSAF